MGLSLLMTACGGGQVTPSAVAAVSGTVVEAVPVTDMATEYTLQTKPWTGGAGVVKGELETTTTPMKLGDLAASGNFTATLPSPQASELMAAGDLNVGDSCTGQYKVSDTTAKIALLGLSVDVANPARDGGIAPLVLSLKGNINTVGTGTAAFDMQIGLLVYSDRALTMTGNENCQATAEGFNYTQATSLDLRLATGWNLVTFKDAGNLTYTDGDVTAAQETLSLKSGSLPTNKWVWGGGGLSPLGVSKGFNLSIKPADLLTKAKGLLR